MTYFPWRLGVDCQLGKEAADTLHVLSRNLRTCLQRSTPRDDVRPNPDTLRSLLLTGRLPGQSQFLTVGDSEVKPSEWQQPQAIPAILQLLQAENTPIRLLMIELLSNIEGKEASVALAQRSVYDLSPTVREKAVEALSTRPASEYRQVLLDSLLYPLQPVTDHAAEALVALKDQDSVMPIIDLLKEPHSAMPFTIKEKDTEIVAVREVVKLNHLSNCMLCHAPSTSKADLVRGRIPIPGEDPPPLYYQEERGLFVRADTTFLRQDFSVVQPVASSGKWPGNQRYDYVMRTRPLSKVETANYERLKEKGLPERNEQREALLFALRELTDQDLGTSYDDWKGYRKGPVREK